MQSRIVVNSQEESLLSTHKVLRIPISYWD